MTDSIETAPKPVKAKRAPSVYNLFMKEHYPETLDLPVRERLKKIGVMWAEHKAAVAASGSGLVGGSQPEKKRVKKVKPRRRKKVDA
jgi:hypothetical protein